MNIRPATVADLPELLQLWRDAAWDTEVEDCAAELRTILPLCRCLLADEPAAGVGAMAMAMSGEMQFLDSSLPLSAVLAVLSAAHARRRGYSGGVLATLLQQERQRGAAVAVLGAFDQGYYEGFGFGSGGYDPVMVIDPAALRLPVAARRALDSAGGVRVRRLTVADRAALFATHARRPRGHGACTAGSDGFTAAMIASVAGKLFAMGVYEGGGDGGGGGDSEQITAYFIGVLRGPEKLDIIQANAVTPAHYLQLLEVIHRLSDQLEQVKLTPPPTIELQDFIARPLRDGLISAPHPFDTALLWQLRILDLPRAIRAVRLSIAAPLRFRLRLHDPLARHLSSDGWNGCAGEYAVRFGPVSECVPLSGGDGAPAGGVADGGVADGAAPAGDPPLLDASIGAFSRFWSGAARPAALCHSDHFRASPALIDQLERLYFTPPPRRDWDF